MGGYSRLLQVSCERCGNVVALYQKDGPGPLKRMYLDRIMEPQKLVVTTSTLIGKVPPLTCSKCKHVLGVPYIYQKEKRSAFRLFEGSVTKKIIKTA